MTDNIKPLPNRERDEMAAELESIRRYAPQRAEAMMLVYDAYLDAGFEHHAAQYFVAAEFLQDD